MRRRPVAAVGWDSNVGSVDILWFFSAGSWFFHWFFLSCSNFFSQMMGTSSNSRVLPLLIPDLLARSQPGYWRISPSFRVHLPWPAGRSERRGAFRVKSRQEGPQAGLATLQQGLGRFWNIWSCIANNNDEKNNNNNKNIAIVCDYHCHKL